ncbi:MAG TPA: hypothetical protein VL262_08390 [Vicinamibacterales bacterium]|jgi:hypothetical protein|nr:hypothetical protein [Vicinamibacterales bacterium]
MASARAFRRTGTAAAVALVMVCAPAGLLGAPPQDQTIKPAPPKGADPAMQAQVEQMQSLVRLTDSAMMGQPAPSDFPIEFQNDFIRAQGARVWIPMTLTIDSSKLSNPAGEPMTVYLRVAPRGMTAPPPPPPAPKDSKDKKKKDAKNPEPPPPSPYAFEDFAQIEPHPSAPGQPIRIMRGLGVPAGNYDLYIALQERGPTPPKTAVLKQPLDVPNYASEFSTSSVIIASETKQLPSAITPEQQADHPYSFGTNEIVVSPDHVFKKAQEMLILLQVYNPTITADKKFSVQVTYTFFKQGPAGESRFNATAPQDLTPETLGPAFDPSAADRSIQAGQGIPLQSFPDGKYRLEITITDKDASPAKTLTQSVNFTVTP